MTIASCPKCDQQITVPATAGSTARVRCPLCQAEYGLQEVLERMPPMLVLLDEAPAQNERPTFDFGTGAKQAEDAEFSLADPEKIVRESSVEFSSPPRDLNVLTALPQRREKNVPVEVVKIGLGGVAGIVLAVLIMWWGFRIDPFGLAPKLPAGISFLAPAKLRGVVLPVEEFIAPEPDHDQNGMLGAGGDVSLVDDAPPSETDPPPPTSELPQDSEPGTSDDSLLQVSDAPSYTAKDLQAAIQLARQAMPAVTQAADMEAKLTNEQRKQLVLEFYEKFCALADTITFLKATQQETQEHLKWIDGVCRELGSAAGQRKLIGTLAARKLARQEPAGGGILLAGTVKDIRSHGPLFESRIQLAGKSRKIVSVYSRKDPTAAFGPESMVLILGAVIQHPVKQLDDYKGDDTPIVLGGYPVKLPVKP